MGSEKEIVMKSLLIFIFTTIFLFAFDNYRVSIKIDGNHWYIDENFHYIAKGRIWKNIPISQKEEIKNIKLYIDGVPTNFKSFRKGKVFIIDFFAKGEHNFHFQYEFVSYEKLIALAPIWWNEKVKDIVINIDAKDIKNLEVISKPMPTIEKIGNKYLITLDKLDSYSLQIKGVVDKKVGVGYYLLILYLIIVAFLFYKIRYTKKVIDKPIMDSLKMGYIYYKEVNPRILMAYLLEKGKINYQLSTMKFNSILNFILLFFNRRNNKIEIEIENRKLNLLDKGKNELQFMFDIRNRLKKEFPFKNNFLYISLGILVPLYLYFAFNSSFDDLFCSLFFLLQFVAYYMFSRYLFNWFRYLLMLLLLFISIKLMISGTMDFSSSLYPIIVMIMTSITISKKFIKDNYLEDVIGYKNYLESLDFESLKKLYETDNQILDDIFPYAVLFNIQNLLKIYKQINYIIPACHQEIECIELFEKIVENGFSVKVEVRGTVS